MIVRRRRPSGPTRRKRHVDEMLPGDVARDVRASHAVIILVVERAAFEAQGDDDRFGQLVASALAGYLS